MAKAACPNCQNRVEITAALSGKTVRCRCGTTMRIPNIVPKSSAAVSTPVVMPSEQATVSVQTCSCGKKLRVTAAAVGKKIQCPCGNIIQVADNSDPFANGQPIPVIPVSASQPPINNVLNAMGSLPPVNYSAPSYANVNPYSSFGNSVPSSTSNAAEQYLKNARKSIREERRQSSGVFGHMSRGAFVLFMILTFARIISAVMRGSAHLDEVNRNARPSR